MTNKTRLTRADFSSDQEVRWCPGCGDYAILAAMQRLLPELNIPKENLVFVSGIGCAGRFPYYMDTYGFHTIHGRAPSVATGLKLVNPDLSVWVITGDGDALSIGGNHLIHLFRRNVNVKVLLFNNRIYGLTKGQFSPTSEIGKVTNTSPHGTVEQAIDPIKIALAAGATFIARGLDTDVKRLQSLLTAAAEHKGTAFIEIYQNCNIFNDKAFDSFAHKSVRADRTVWLEQGKPLVFGKENDQALCWDGQLLKKGAYDSVSNVIVHETADAPAAYTYALADMDTSEFPVPFGIFRQASKPVFDEALSARRIHKKPSKKAILSLLKGRSSWEI